jgi:S1-C subfamily serine protease
MKAAIVVASFGIGVVLSALVFLGRVADEPAPPRLVAPRGELAPQEETVIALFEATRSSVVSITTEERVLDPWTRRAVDVPRGTGSGFVWDAQGHIVTNAHVIRGASSARVRLADGQLLEAGLVGTAPRQDLAVLRVDPERDPPPIPLGRSETLRVGQSVLAIGNPFGLDWTLTTGIISALDREIPGERGTITGLIQTDAAINPGNSGGPLIDSAGRLIGVNTAIFSRSGSSAGIGFAVPVDVVNRVVPQLISTGRYRPPVLGVVHDPRINEMARRQGIEGVLVLDVEPGSPAARAGLRPARQTSAGLVPRDIIRAIEGRTVETSEDLRAALETLSPGQDIAVTVLRDGGEVRVTLTLAEADP